MRRWWLVIVVVLSLGVNIGVLSSLAANRMGVVASPSPQPAVQRPVARDRLNLLCDHLGLSGEVRERFIERQRRFLRETDAARKHLNELRRAMRSELTAPKPNRQLIDQLDHEAADVFFSLEQALTDNVFESRALLPPAAEARYVEIVSRLQLEGPGQYGHLPRPLWTWWLRRPSSSQGDNLPAEGEGPAQGVTAPGQPSPPNP